MQLGEASADEAFRVRYFPLSLTGSTFQCFTSLPPQSVGTWRELEQKFHAHYFSGSTEKKLIDLTTLKQRHNETPLEFLRRFREVKGMCFSLTLPNDQLADMAVAGMLPAVREKLFGMEFDNLGQLSQKLSLMSNQAYGFKKDTRFAKHNDIADIYNRSSRGPTRWKILMMMRKWPPLKLCGARSLYSEPAMDQANQGHVRLRCHQS
jgi:hypothetical protein